MARPMTPTVNLHVTYYTAACKPRPATVTSVIDATTVNLRVEHSGETYSSIQRNVVGILPNTWKVK